LVLLELHLEAEVGTDVASDFTDVFEGVDENGVVLLHVVGDDEGGGLNRSSDTLEMPAPQCTRTEPRLRSC
jgi:hypothetical protein